MRASLRVACHVLRYFRVPMEESISLFDRRLTKIICKLISCVQDDFSILLESQLGPDCIDARFGGAVHFDHGGPGAVEAFGLPFARGVDAHLGTVVRQARGVIERIDGTESELDVALRVDVVRYSEDNLSNVLHVAILIHHDDAFGEHGLAERPDGVHHFARLAG